MISSKPKIVQLLYKIGSVLCIGSVLLGAALAQAPAPDPANPSLEPAPTTPPRGDLEFEVVFEFDLQRHSELVPSIRLNHPFAESWLGDLWLVAEGSLRLGLERGGTPSITTRWAFGAELDAPWATLFARAILQPGDDQALVFQLGLEGTIALP